MSERYEGQTFYEILEVKPSAGPAEIYAAYQRARATYSPSSPALYSMFSPGEAQELMALIEEAYQTLSHQARRKEYDTKIGVSVAPVVRVAAPELTPEQARAKREDQWVGPVKVTQTRHQETPAGFARTKFSLYEIKPELEKEIAAIEECDGTFLQKARLYRGVSLDQMAEEIRVGKSTLVALEGNDLSALPVAVFTRGFVVQYARALGLNERKVSDAYMKYFKAKKT